MMDMGRHAASSSRGQIVMAVGGVLALIIATGVTLVAWQTNRDPAGAEHEWFVVKRGDFDISIPCSGELVALDQVEINNQLESEGLITQIIEEGKMVSAGDTLVKFNDEELRAKLNEAIDAVNLADASLVAAESELSVRQKERESELQKVHVTVELADLAFKAFEDGEDASKRVRLELARDSAKMNSERLQEYYQSSIKLCDQKVISLDELRKDEIAMFEAKSKLDQAQIDLDVYVKYQSKQDRAKKSSDLTQAQGELERAIERQEAKVRSAQSDVASKKMQLTSKRERQRLLEQQVSFCHLTAPSPGMVVYASSMDSQRWYSNEPPHVGSKIYPNQPIIYLPDTSKMAASVKVSEALSGSIRVGQKASIVSDALPNQPLSGEVTSISVLAESDRWRDPNRRDFSVKIKLNDSGDAKLKPSMRCQADIHIEKVESAIHVPLQAVHCEKPLTFVYVPDGRGWSQRKVTLGRSSELYVEIKDGLAVGDRVLLRQPQPQEIASRLPVEKPGTVVESGTAAAATQPAAAESPGM